MPRTSIVDSDKAKAAVSVLIRAPGITVREAMILAKFTEGFPRPAKDDRVEWKGKRNRIHGRFGTARCRRYFERWEQISHK